MTTSSKFSRRDFLKAGSAAATGFLLFDSILAQAAADTESLPNILWITSEDNSAYFSGCYGNDFATTPNLDKLASEGFLYTHAYAACPVCAPARNTILTGVYAASNGNENMRSSYAKSDIVKTYPEYLREAGYYCTNNSKTDYNCSGVNAFQIWDESSGRAHYRNRPEGKPFFAVFNSMISHESSIHRQTPTEQLRHNPEEVTLPPYHPDTPEMRHDWAQYYDRIEDMDAWVGGLLQELEDSGLAEDTIVIYYGDNGGVLARSKRFIYETGTRVPFIIRIPEKYSHSYPAGQPGQKVDRIVNFVDLTPTLLSLADVPVPGYIQGKAFLGEQKTEYPEYTFMTRQRMDERHDLVRAVRDNKFRYIRNYMPFRITMQHVNYLFNASSAQSWEDAFKEGQTNEVQSKFFQPKPVEELYDTENDQWEVNNLADNPEYADVLERMRNALTNWQREVRDVGLIPEAEYSAVAGDVPLYDYMRSADCPFDKLIEASEKAILGGSEEINTFIKYLQDDHRAVRYWGATGLLILKDAAQPAVEALKTATNDEAGSVATLAAETLYGLGQTDAAVQAYINILQSDVYDGTDKNFALNSLDALDITDPGPELVEAVRIIDARGGRGGDGGNAAITANYLLQEWGI